MTNRVKTEPTVTGLVLAGGRSIRFGDADTNKAVATLKSRTLLGRVVDRLTPVTDRPPVVAVHTSVQRATYGQLLADREVAFASDSPAFEGPIAGLFGGLDAIETPWVFCCGCDMPLLSSIAVDWLVERLADFRTAPASDPDVLAVRHPDGTIDPLHALYRTAAVDSARDQLSETDGLRALIDQLESVVTLSSTDAPPTVPLDRSMTNVNTRSELDAVSHRLTPER